jgi:hypothetical protein
MLRGIADSVVTWGDSTSSLESLYLVEEHIQGTYSKEKTDTSKHGI